MDDATKIRSFVSFQSGKAKREFGSKCSRGNDTATKMCRTHGPTTLRTCNDRDGRAANTHTRALSESQTSKFLNMLLFYQNAIQTYVKGFPIRESQKYLLNIYHAFLTIIILHFSLKTRLHFVISNWNWERSLCACAEVHPTLDSASKYIIPRLRQYIESAIGSYWQVTWPSPFLFLFKTNFLISHNISTILRFDTLTQIYLPHTYKMISTWKIRELADKV